MPRIPAGPRRPGQRRGSVLRLTDVAAGTIRTPDQRLRVFISSTLGELADERRAARAAVEQLRLTPVMFELGARPHPPRALYRSYLDQSEVFVGIYWQSYGWVASDMEISGLEDEFVLSDGMPRLLSVKRPAPDRQPRLAEMLDRVQREDTASYKPFQDADELHDLLLDDLAILLAERFDGGGEAPTTEPLPRSNLPAETSTFLGRAAELRDLREILPDDEIRFITLTGPGGTGKTRLAIRAAAEERAHFPDGVFFVDLSAEREVDGALAAVARTVLAGVPSDIQPLDELEAELRDRKVLLVLDNLEQVAPAAVDLIALLEHCPAVNLLVTSREALHVRGERIFPVPPLSLPAEDDLLAAGESEAVRLFCDRAAAVLPGFALDDANAGAISAICRRLDGLPLAIELAAARVQLFDVDELRARLEDRLEVLRGGARDLPERQRTLRDAIEWSYDLLTADERETLRFFTVFADARLADVDATAARVEALRGTDVIESLGSLVDKSLVRSSQGADNRPRFSMLQTIRAFAAEERDADPELASAVRLAHAEHYTELAVGLREDLTYASRNDVLAKLSAELGNLRNAWNEWAARGDVLRLNDLLGPLWGYFDARGDYRTAVELGRDLLACLAAAPDSPDRRRDEFVVHMNVARTELAVRGFTDEADRLTREALDRADAAEDVGHRFPGLRSLAYLRLMRSDFEGMSAVAGELMEIAERTQDPSLLSDAHLLVGLGHLWNTEFPVALEHFDEVEVNFEATGSGYVDFHVGPNQGVVAFVVSALTRWLLGSPDAACTTMHRALDLAAELDHPYSVAYALQHAALLELWQGDLAGMAERADALRVLAEARDYPTWRALSMVFAGLGMVGSGDADAGMARVEEGVELYKGLSAPPVFWPALLMIRATALGMAGRAPEGLAYIEQARAALQPGDPQAYDMAIAHGDLLLAVSPENVSVADAMFEQVAQLAEENGARMAQLQALTRLISLRAGAAGTDDVVRALQKVYDGFTEGFETAHLVAARAALEGAG